MKGSGVRWWAILGHKGSMRGELGFVNIFSLDFFVALYQGTAKCLGVTTETS